MKKMKVTVRITLAHIYLLHLAEHVTCYISVHPPDHPREFIIPILQVRNLRLKVGWFADSIFSAFPNHFSRFFLLLSLEFG